MLNYKLPSFFVTNVEPPMWYVGVVFCILITLADISVSKSMPISIRYGCDVMLIKAVIIYTAFIFFSVMLMSEYSFMRKATLGVDVALLLFIIIPCLKTEKDKLLLLKGAVFGAFLMAAIGMFGYIVDDPSWGHTISKDQKAIIEIRSIPDLSYKNKLALQKLYERGKTSSELSLRPRFTASSPNDMALVMLVTIPLVIFIYFHSKNNIFDKLILSSIIILFISSILLSGSRTIVIFSVLVLPILFLKLYFLKYVSRIGLLLLFLGLVLLSSFMLFSDIGSSTIGRMSSLTTVNDVMDANGRIARWKIHLRLMKPYLLVIGNGRIGSVGGGSSIGHMNYISTMYRGGAIALTAFLIILFIGLKKSLILKSKLLGFCIFTSILIYVISGITLDINVSTGPPFIFWTLIAVLAKDRFKVNPKFMIRNNRVNIEGCNPI